MKFLYNLKETDFLKYYTVLGCITKEWKIEQKKNEELHYEPQNFLISEIKENFEASQVLYNKINKIHTRF